MRIYIDTNVFDLIVKSDEVEEVSAWLRFDRHSVLVSSQHVSEILGIPDDGQRTVAGLTRFLQLILP